MVKGPRLLFWDVETTHNLVATFQLKQQDYIPAENIIQERYLVSAAWKWFGERSVHAVSVLDNPALFSRAPHDDAHVVRVLHGVLSQADVIIAHNGDAYDIKFTEGRMLYHGMPPLPPIPSVDTLKIARHRFLFNANNLDYLGNFLKVGRKKPTQKGLWLKVLRGDKTAIKQMVSYNKEDVRLLERVYLKLRPYADAHPNQALFLKDNGGCPKCGSTRIIKGGVRVVLTQKYQRYQCQACGGWCRDRKAVNGARMRGL